MPPSQQSLAVAVGGWPGMGTRGPSARHSSRSRASRSGSCAVLGDPLGGVLRGHPDGVGEDLRGGRRGASPTTEPGPWVASQAARTAAMVVDFPVPAAPTSTSSRRPEVTTAATAEACSAESTWALPGAAMGPSLATTEGAQPARRRLGRRPGAALRRRGALGGVDLAVAARSMLDPSARCRCSGARVTTSGGEHDRPLCRQRGDVLSHVTRSLAAVNRTPWKLPVGFGEEVCACERGPLVRHLGQHNGGSIPKNPLLQVARGRAAAAHAGRSTT